MQKARLLRSGTDKMLAGVCGGIATYLGVDSVFVRLAFLVLAFASGVGFLIYLILMVIMPSEAKFEQSSSKVVQDNLDQYGNDISSNIKRIRTHPQGPVIAAGLLIVLGFYLLFSNLGWLAWLGSGVFWALFLIGAGIFFMARRNRENGS
ncbi:MAG TPA: PspC domain-containing protein [Patescibacteria group bacterium]|jgi:phage shock protein PspC (stress-responsive transcriptional regulator)|nr:PspC domain-containing protein [Patescibacteria group bacterium]